MPTISRKALPAPSPAMFIIISEKPGLTLNAIRPGVGGDRFPRFQHRSLLRFIAFDAFLVALPVDGRDGGETLRWVEK